MTSLVAGLPAIQTPLIGRSTELDAVIEAVRGNTRLVTLTGAAGVGKTRLAIEAAHALVKDFGGAVHFVALAPITDPTDVFPSIASALNLRVGARTGLEVLIEYFLEYRSLLVLDNLEHLRPAWADLEALLESCPALVVFATSREALRLRLERVVQLAPLEVPDRVDLEQARSASAIAMFVQSAAAMRPGYELTAENVGGITELCRRLDGLPLALELAASRINLLSPEAMLSRLEALKALPSRRFTADAPDRHRSLEAAIAWSVNALDAQHRAALEQLSVFSGGWSLEAAEAVFRQNPDINAEVLDLIADLADQHLITPITDAASEGRFTMLETIRSYNHMQLRQREAYGSAVACHAAWVLDVVSAARDALRSSAQGTAHAQLNRELDNIRGALRETLNLESSELALHIAGLLGPFWFTHHPSEGRRWLEQTLAANPVASAALRATALDALANLARLFGDLSSAHHAQEAALELLSELPETGGRAVALNNLAVTLRYEGLYERSIELHNQALAVWEQRSDRVNAARARSGIGLCLMLLGRLEEATAAHEMNLVAAHASGNTWLVALGMSNLGATRAVNGEAVQAMAMLEEALRLARTQADQPIIVSALLSLGAALLIAQSPVRARVILEEALVQARSIDNAWDATTALSLLGQTLLELNELEESQATLEEALRLAVKLGHRQRLARILETFAALAVRTGRPNGAAVLLGVARATRAEFGIAVFPAERDSLEVTYIDVRSRLGAKFDDLSRRGEQIKFEHVLDEVSAALETEVNQSLVAPKSEKSNLSPRELEVLQLIADGRTNKQIGKVLGISEHTARFHVTGVLNKLGAATRAHAVALATASGLTPAASER